MFKIYDASMAIYPGMPVYKNKPEKQPAVEVTRDFEHGIRESRIILDTHTGTHVDAPLHVIPGGPGVEGLDAANFFGLGRVLDLTGVKERITRADLVLQGIQPGDFILLKTSNSWQEGFSYDFIYITADAAAYLAECRVRGVGLDALGIEREQPDHATHRTLLGKGIMVIEGLRLKDIPPGSYMLLVAPLKLVGVEAAPARVFLLGCRHSKKY